MSETPNNNEVAVQRAQAQVLPPSAAETQLAICSSAAASESVPRPLKELQTNHRLASGCSGALHRYQHYAATLGRELALLLLCQGSSALTAAVSVSYQLAHLLGLHLHRWLRNSHVPKAAAAVLARVLRSMQALLQQYVAGPLGRLLTQLVWVQIQLSTDDVLDEGTRMSARLNSCVSLLFGSIRLRSHSCLQLATPSRQPILAPEFSLSSPAPSPTKMSSVLRAQQQQQQRQQQEQQLRLLRSASTPTPHSSPRGARPAAAGTAAAAATAPFGSSRRRTGVAGSPTSSSMNPWGDLSQAKRASVARALRFSQHPGQGSADSEVHVLCSSELKLAIMSFLQAHSRRNGSEFVLLRNFNTSAPPTPTTGTSLAVTPTAAEAEAAAAGALASVDDDSSQQQQQQQQQQAAVDALVSGVDGAQSGTVTVAVAADVEAPIGFDAAAALGFDTGCELKPQVQQFAQIYAVAADGSSGGGSSCWSASVQLSSLRTNPLEQQQQQWGPLPLLGEAAGQQQQQQYPEPDWGTPRGSLTLAEAWEQAQQQPGQQQQQDTADAPMHSSDVTCPLRGTGSSGSGGSRVLAAAANLLAAAAEALGDERVPDSPRKCGTSPQKATTAQRAAAAIAAAAADGSNDSVSSSNSSRHERCSFVSAADKFRSLAASAAAADGGSDLCSKPLMAFSRMQGPSSPVMLRRSACNRAAETGSSLHQQEQYARLFPPGSRSFEALSLRNSGGKSPIGTPACHARNTVTFVKKKLPAAPFSLSASLPLTLDGEVLQESS